MQQWVILYKTRNLAEANIIIGVLQENNIHALLMNKQDSSYLNFGDIEIHVPMHLQQLAQSILQQNIQN